MSVAVKVLEGEAIYLMGFEGADLAIFQDRIILYGGEVMDNDRYCTTVLVRHSKFKVCSPSQYAGVCVLPHALRVVCMHAEMSCM